MNITNKLDDPLFQTAMDIIDPFSYRDKILMPKLVVDGTMDEFFLLDDSSYWWHEMPNNYELNRFVMVPNAEHTQITGIEIQINLLTFTSTWPCFYPCVCTFFITLLSISKYTALLLRC